MKYVLLVVFLVFTNTLRSQELKGFSLEKKLDTSRVKYVGCDKSLESLKTYDIYCTVGGIGGILCIHTMKNNLIHSIDFQNHNLTDINQIAASNFRKNIEQYFKIKLEEYNKTKTSNTYSCFDEKCNYSLYEVYSSNGSINYILFSMESVKLDKEIELILENIGKNDF